MKEDEVPSRSLLSEVGAVDITFCPTFVVNQFRREGRVKIRYIDGRLNDQKVSAITRDLWPQKILYRWVPSKGDLARMRPRAFLPDENTNLNCSFGLFPADLATGRSVPSKACEVII